MIEFVREHVVRSLDDDEVYTRREAAITCCRLLKASVATDNLRMPREGRTLGPRRKRILVEEILDRLLVAAVADPDEGVRRAVLASLPEGAGVDENLAQADSLRAVFIALNDEVRRKKERRRRGGETRAWAASTGRHDVIVFHAVWCLDRSGAVSQKGEAHSAFSKSSL
jgi:hypothetical protein